MYRFALLFSTLSWCGHGIQSRPGAVLLLPISPPSGRLSATPLPRPTHPMEPLLTVDNFSLTFPPGDRESKPVRALYVPADNSLLS